MRIGNKGQKQNTQNHQDQGVSVSEKKFSLLNSVQFFNQILQEMLASIWDLVHFE